MELFTKMMYMMWRVWTFPLHFTYLILMKLSFLFQRWHYEKFFLPTPVLKYFWNLDSYIIQQYTEHLPNNLLEWINPYLDKKTKEDYMRAITPKKVFDYVCKADLEEVKKGKMVPSDQTVFKLRLLTVQESSDLRNNMYKVNGAGKGRKESFQTGSMEVEALLKGLRGWENLKDESGAAISFDATKVADMLEYLNPDVRSELAARIRGEQEEPEGEG